MISIKIGEDDELRSLIQRAVRQARIDVINYIRFVLFAHSGGVRFANNIFSPIE